MKQNRNKFGAKKTVVDGITFDSKKEAQYYIRLNMMTKASNKTDRVLKIELQPKYDIVINGKKVAFYKADFKVLYGDGRIEIVDVKGLKSGAAYQYFKLKKKIVEALYNIEIIEV